MLTITRNVSGAMKCRLRYPTLPDVKLLNSKLFDINPLSQSAPHSDQHQNQCWDNLLCAHHHEHYNDCPNEKRDGTLHKAVYHKYILKYMLVFSYRVQIDRSSTCKLVIL